MKEKVVGESRGFRRGAGIAESKEQLICVLGL